MHFSTVVSLFFVISLSKTEKNFIFITGRNKERLETGTFRTFFRTFEFDLQEKI